MTQFISAKILVVEDHLDSANMLARLLKKSGYQVEMADKVKDALSAAQVAEATGETFTLVVSDLGLPDGTGYELMEKLRALYQLPGIALSGYGQAEDVRRALDSGFAFHLTKPIDFTRLKEAIQSVIAGVSSTAETAS